jgi:hypothetical protein
VALVAFFVSFAGFLVSVATYRRAGPRVRVRTQSPRDWKPTDDDLFITITAYNRGLAPVQVVTLRLAMANPTFGTALSRSLGLGNDDCLEGPALPLLLAEGHQEQWTFDALEAAKRQFGDLGDNLHGLASEFFRRKRPERYWPATKAVGRDLLLSVIPLYGWLYSLFALSKMGVVAVVDLGNGVQVVTAPMRRLTWQLGRVAWQSKTNRWIRRRRVDPRPQSR